jgi:hypothetical protein
MSGKMRTYGSPTEVVSGYPQYFQTKAGYFLNMVKATSKDPFQLINHSTVTQLYAPGLLVQYDDIVKQLIKKAINIYCGQNSYFI